MLQSASGLKRLLRKGRVELSTLSSDRATSTTQTQGEILLVKISDDQTGKRSVPSGDSGHPPLCQRNSGSLGSRCCSCGAPVIRHADQLSISQIAE